ncbi:hypothetical protein FNV43_RR07948 [Rhamnella rubrinervis]|uniref:FAS1 domain-containing protein n=1 Tax=Rhamnella rubrinervis TaxID=2594499 RepID=A0A8K0MMU1_9ROSA|nr:hypothetical protein FNV43_RR07948 [Rhamnella rubrinervis]
MFMIFLVLLILSFSESKRTPQVTTRANGGVDDHTDLESAIMEMRSNSYHGFAILLQMLDHTWQPTGTSLTFFVPSDSELSQHPILAYRLQTFLLSHAMPMSLQFNDLVHFPNGTLVPSAQPNRMIRIRNRGRGEFFVNNARIVAPNVCLNSSVKCHGIDKVINYA